MITPSFLPTATERVLPKLALDFTTASLDSRITFTRTTNATNPATYTNSSGVVTSATDNQARFDYDPVALTCKGLLIEESRANLLKYSADLSNSVWIKSQASIDSTKITAPDATTSGQKLVENSATAQHIAYVGSLGLGSAIYTMSGYFKAAERTQAWLRLDTGTTTRQAIFDLSAVTATAGGGTTATIQSVGNGWYRCTMSLTGAETLINAVLMLGSGGASSYAGNGTSGLYMWGIQLEAGAFATSYIPTTSAALTRNADVVTMTGTNFSSWYNSSEGTFLFKADSQTGATPAASCYGLHIDDGTTTKRIVLWKVATTGNAQFTITDTTNQCSISTGAWGADNVTNTVVGTYKQDSFAAAKNGGSVGTDTSGTVPTGLNRMSIGAELINSRYWNGHIQKISYWPQRLINVEVQSFSK